MSNVTSWIKFGIILSAIFAILIGIIIWQHNTLSKQQIDFQKSLVEFKQLQDNIARASEQTVSKKDLETFIKNSGISLGPIQDDLDKLKAQLEGISVSSSSTPGYQGQSLSSTSTQIRTNIPTDLSNDPFGYLKKSQKLTLLEPTFEKSSIPIGDVEFKAWEQKPWNINIFPRKYVATTVIGEDENGKHYTYNKLFIKVNDQEYPLKIDDSKFVEEHPNVAKFSFNPRIYLAIDAGVEVHPDIRGEVTPNFQIVLFSYGETKTSPNWTFLGLGAGYNTQSQNFGGVISPVSYNVGKHIPFMSNLEIGPTIGLDVFGEISIMGGMRVGL